MINLNMNKVCNTIHLSKNLCKQFGPRLGPTNVGFVCGTMSCAKSSLHWSVIHYRVTFERYSKCVSEMSFVVVIHLM